MAYGLQNLRRSARFDMLSPGSSDQSEYSDEEFQPSQTYEPSDTRVLGPDGVPLESSLDREPPSGLAKVADISVDPNDDSNARLRAMIDTIQGSYNPATRSRDRNDALLDSFPERGQPTKMDRLSAFLLSVGQPNPGEITEKTLQAPYYRDRADWVAKTEPFYKAAQLENTANTQERQVLGNAITGFSAAERTAQAQEKARQQYDVTLQRNNILDFKVKHPDWEFDFSGPRGHAYNPLNPNEQIDLGPTGHMSDLEKLTLQGKNAKDVATIRAGATTGAAQIRANGTGGTGTSSAQFYRDSNGLTFRMQGGRAVDVNGNPVTPSDDFEKISTAREPVDNASNQAKDYENRLIRTHNNTPEGRKYIYYDGKQWMVKPRPTQGMWGDASGEMAEYDRMMKSIDPNYNPPGGSPGTTSTPTPQGSNLPGGPIKTGSGDGTLRSKAADYLTKHGKPVTQANIDWVIKQGRVK